MENSRARVWQDASRRWFASSANGTVVGPFLDRAAAVWAGAHTTKPKPKPKSTEASHTLLELHAQPPGKRLHNDENNRHLRDPKGQKAGAITMDADGRRHAYDRDHQLLSGFATPEEGVAAVRQEIGRQVR